MSQCPHKPLRISGTAADLYHFFIDYCTDGNCSSNIWSGCCKSAETGTGSYCYNIFSQSPQPLNSLQCGKLLLCRLKDNIIYTIIPGRDCSFHYQSIFTLSKMSKILQDLQGIFTLCSHKGI